MQALTEYIGGLTTDQGWNQGRPFYLFPWERRFLGGPNPGPRGRENVIHRHHRNGHAHSYEEKTMSSVFWDKDNLIQRVGSNIEELGHIRHEENSNQYVLWLKDTRGGGGGNKGYIRGDTFPSMEDAKQNAASSTSARIFHYMWLTSLRDKGNETGRDVAQAIEGVESGKPLTESTFKEEMDKLKAESEKQARFYFVMGALASIVVSIFVTLIF